MTLKGVVLLVPNRTPMSVDLSDQGESDLEQDKTY